MAKWCRGTGGSRTPTRPARSATASDGEEGRAGGDSRDGSGDAVRGSGSRTPLWPQLRRILEPYLEDPGHDSPLLFPSWSGGVLNDLRKSFDTLQKRTEDMDKHLTRDGVTAAHAPTHERPTFSRASIVCQRLCQTAFLLHPEAA